MTIKYQTLVIAIIIIIAIGIFAGWAFTAGSYRTNTAVTALENQAYTNGYNQAAQAIFNDAAQCGGTAVIEVTTSTQKIQCAQ